MKNTKKTKDQLVKEIHELRMLLADWQKSYSEFTESYMQKKLVEYEKLSALGRLTANVAHEIRNPITVIGGLTERLKKSSSLKEKQKEYVELISYEAKRLEEILKDVLIYSSEPFLNKRKYDLNKLVNDSLRIYQELFKRFGIRTRKSLKKITPLYMDKRHIQEALNNLLMNAVDAMPKGGTLTVSSDEDSFNSKNYVMLRVKDTGTGISKENLSMIFEPFFTTKTTKKETGLGLPITRKIVEVHGGFIKVDSTVGKGATFTLFLPYRSR